MFGRHPALRRICTRNSEGRPGSRPAIPSGAVEADPPAAANAAPPAAAPRRSFSVGGAFARWEWLALGGIALLYLLVVVLSIRRGPPLGWDESVYSLRTRDFAEGVTPRHYWDAYRAPGLPWLLHLLWGIGSHPTVFRLAVAAFGLGLVVVTWLLARHLFGLRAGLIAAVGVALAPPLLLAATQVWPDVPGAAVGLLAVALFVFATGGERPSWWMVALAPLAGAATFLRYGAPLPIAIGLVVVAVWRRRLLLRHPAPALVSAAAASAAVAVVLLLPRLTGAASSPLGAITGFNRSWFEGFGDFASLAHEVVGPAAVVLALIGVVVGIGKAGPDGAERGALLAAVAVSVVTVVAIAFVLHGEVRYLTPAFPWLFVAGAPGLERLGRSLPRAAGTAAAAVVVVALAATAVGVARERNRDLGTEHTTVRQAAEEITALADGRPCLVVASRVPQVMWYSACEATTFDLDEVRLPRRAGTVIFMLWVGGDRRQPEGDLLAAYRAAAGGPVVVIEGRRPAQVHLVREPAAAG